MVILKSFDVPTDVYIIGTLMDSIDTAFQIKDDESSFDVTNGGEKKYISTDGFVTIVTKEKLIENKSDLDEYGGVFEGDFRDGLFLKDFVGDIKLSGYDDDGNDKINEKNFGNDKYLMYHIAWVDLVISLPDGCEYEVDDLYNLTKDL